ncbi:MAG: type IV pilus assembly protein PilM [Candidatus Buchananbacteria bacterium]
MIFNLNKNIFGLDISDRALRLVQLKKQGKKNILVSYNDLEIPEKIIVGGEIKEEEELAKLISQLIKTVRGKKINSKEVITVLPESKTFIKVIQVKSTGKENLPNLIKEEIKNHIPLSADEIYLDWQILGQPNEMTNLLIGAAPRAIVDSYYSAIEKAGLIPYVFEIEADAIMRSLTTKDDSATKMIIDLGAVRTGLIIYDHKTVQFTASLSISGIKITETIANTLNLNPKEAEKAKIICGLNPQKCEGALLKILLKPIDDLIAQIEKTITIYQSNFPESNPISKIILCGGGANLSNIDKILSEKLKLPVEIGNPLINISETKKIFIPTKNILSYSTAIGLALRAFQKKI